MPWRGVNDLIEQGYLIKDADTKWAGEAWKLPADMRTSFDDAFVHLRTTQADCENARIAKEKAVSIAQTSRAEIEHSLARLKQFIRAVANKTLAADMFHTLGIDAEYPLADTDFVTLLFSTVVPHLNDWDGTPQQIEAALKTEIQTGTTKFADAVRDADEAIATSTTATQDRDIWRDTYENILTQIRNWLYLKLPHGKYDSKLDEYGFEVWDKPPVHKLYPPGGLRYKAQQKEFSWKAVKAAEAYELRISKDGGDTWKIVYSGAETKAGVVLESAQIMAQVRSVKESSPREESEWGDVLTLDARVPAVPKHLRWAPAEYHGVMMALIEWDAAERAEEYELHYTDNGGDILDVADTFKYEDILGEPRTYHYKVRGVNAFGVGEYSPVLEIVVE